MIIIIRERTLKNLTNVSLNAFLLLAKHFRSVLFAHQLLNTGKPHFY